MPPLAGLGGVAVAEAEQRALGVHRGDGPEAAPVHVRGDVAAPGHQHLGRVAHGLAVDVDDVVDAPGEVVRGPRHDPHGDPVLSGSSASSPVQPITSRSPATASTAKRANSSSAYHRCAGVRSIDLPVVRVAVRELYEITGAAPQADRALPADRRLADAERGQQAGRAGGRGADRRDGPPEPRPPGSGAAGPGSARAPRPSAGGGPVGANGWRPAHVPRAASGRRSMRQYAVASARQARATGVASNAAAAARLVPRDHAPPTGSGRPGRGRTAGRRRCRAAWRTARRACGAAGRGPGRSATARAGSRRRRHPPDVQGDVLAGVTPPRPGCRR